MTRIDERNLEPAARWFVSEWLAALAQVLEQRTGTAPRPERLQALGDDPAPADAVWWAQEFGLREGPAVWIGAAEVDGRDLIRHLGADPDDWSGYELLLGDTFTQLARTLGPRASGEVFRGSGEQTSFPPEAGISLAADIYLAPGTSVRLIVSLAPELAALAADWMSPEASARADYSTQAPAVSETLALLLDLELPVSVSFGKIQLPFQDVLKLATGSIIELNRSVDDPVDIIVNDQVIASGEVVVVNGNYGVRIQKIASRSERLRNADAALLARNVDTSAPGSRLIQ